MKRIRGPPSAAKTTERRDVNTLSYGLTKGIALTLTYTQEYE